MDTVEHDQARAGRALLTLEAEGRANDIVRRQVEIARVVDDQRILAAHLHVRPLEPSLPVVHDRSPLCDAEADLLGTCEVDEASLGMVNQSVADGTAAAREVVDDPVGKTCLPQSLHEPPSHQRCARCGLEHDRVACGNRAHGHAHQDGKGEVPRRYHHTGTNRLEPRLVHLAFEVVHLDRLGHAQSLMRVVAAEVDCLSDICLGLGPVLARLERLPRSEVEPPVRDQVTHPVDQAGAFLCCPPRPVREGSPGRIDRSIDVAHRSRSRRTDHLGRISWVDRLDRCLGVGPSPANDEHCTFPERSPDPSQCLLVSISDMGISEIGIGFCSIGRKHIDSSNRDQLITLRLRRSRILCSALAVARTEQPL